MNHIDTMKLAKDALEPFITPNWAGSGVDKANAAYTALRSALSEQPAQQEPATGAMTFDEALVSARNALTFCMPNDLDRANEIITALASPQPAPVQQEPIGKAHLCDRCSTPFDGEDECPECGHGSATKKQVYAAPQPAQRKPLTPEKVVKLKDAFYAGFESYVTPAAPCSDVDEEWAKYKSAHNIKENT